jgi:D-alanyl-D-alanine endopeptidase (penicillin-binding protein 7)
MNIVKCLIFLRIDMSYFRRTFTILFLLFFVNLTIITNALAAGDFGYYQPSAPSAVNSVSAPASIEIIGQANFSWSQNDFAFGHNPQAFDNKFSLEIPEGFLSGPSRLAMSQIKQSGSLPWNLKKLSDIFEFSISSNAGFASQKNLTVSLVYDQADNNFKQIYYFDEASASWRALPSTDYPGEQKVVASLNQPSAKLAVFSKPGVLTVGKASWYKYQGGMFAASPDFPRGSKLRVTNTDNGKSVEVVVNDWGPERDKHPDRVVDLDKEAFAVLSPTSAGVINVMVSPLEITPDSSGRVLGVKAEAVGSSPKLSAKSVIIMNEATGEVIFDKNGIAKAPLASLTKIVALKIFLDLKPDLEQVVSYKTQDENFNYLYAKKSESARVKLKNGEKLKIKDLFYSALVGSANNAVESLVRVSGVTRGEFIDLMNSQARSWGAGETHFIEPTGLSSANTSSAYDYAVIMKEALKNDYISQVSVTPTYTFKTLSGVKHTIKNTNQLVLNQSQPNLKAEKFAINGSKTGYLIEAGYCLATRVKSGLENYIIVSMGASTRAKSFNEMADLIKYIGNLI